MANNIAKQIMDMALSCAYAEFIGIGTKTNNAEIRAYCNSWICVTGKSRVDFYKELDEEMAEATKDWN